jgi:alkanesulfonate monooxygenase SsuD/methylene tetrahydromethanopterin reductase-like flavin-dependent oxidoreductase (luciferase family)
MKFYVSSAFLDTGEIVEIAKAAEDLGYEGMAIPDHVVNLETLSTPYPYTDDGQRRWQPFTDWPDPWVLVGALSQATERLKFGIPTRLPRRSAPPPVCRAAGWNSASGWAGARKSSPSWGSHSPNAVSAPTRCWN